MPLIEISTAQNTIVVYLLHEEGSNRRHRDESESTLAIRNVKPQNYKDSVQVIIIYVELFNYLYISIASNISKTIRT